MADFDPVSYIMGSRSAGGGGGGGSSTLSGLTDVDISNPADGQTLVYDAASGKWVNGSGGGGGFTLLQGTYDSVEGSISLGVTAGELYALMQTSAVFATYTAPYGEDSDTILAPVDYAVLSIEDGVEQYLFVCNNLSASQLTATDTVVFATAPPK